MPNLKAGSDDKTKPGHTMFSQCTKQSQFNQGPDYEEKKEGTDRPEVRYDDECKTEELVRDGKETGQVLSQHEDLNHKKEAKEIENIPDNIQKIFTNPDTESMTDCSLNSEIVKKEYKKKAVKSGVTDREWLSSKEHRSKWTALDGKRGMCNDCKKMFSSRQVGYNI